MQEKNSKNFFDSKKPKIIYEKRQNPLNLEFNTYLKKKFNFILELEKKLKYKFQEMDEAEEYNTFFELFMEKLLSDCEFHIINYEDFTSTEQSEKIKEIIQDIKTIIENNLTNNLTNTQAIKNLSIISNFYADLKIDRKSLKKTLSATESDFNMKTTPSKLEEDFKAISSYIDKVAKAVGKIRKTQLCFTIEDTQLSELIEVLGQNEEISLEGIFELEKKCDVFLKAIEGLVLRTVEMNFEKEDLELNGRIKKIANSFFNFFRNNENSICKYLAYCYMYRDNVFDEILDDASVFVSDLLRKITCYKTFVFIKFYEEFLEEKIKKELKEVIQGVKNIYNSDSPEKDYRRLKKKNDYVKMIIDFVKAKLTQKKTTQEIFKNDFINIHIPKIITQINLNSVRHYETNSEELDIIRRIMKDLPNYKKSVEIMKKVKLNKQSVKEQIKNHDALRMFNKEFGIMENNITALDSNVDILKKIKKILNSDKEYHLDLISLYFQAK